MRVLPAILTALFLLAPATPARAAAKLVVRGTAVRAHDTEGVEWSGLPGWAQEVELELSLDGGRWVRVSPELEAREGGFRWAVPAIASARARLRLRAGGEHREEVLAESEEFVILSAQPDADPEDWRLGRQTAAPVGVRAGGPRLAPMPPAGALLVEARTSVPAPRELCAVLAVAPTAAPRGERRPPALRATRRGFPLRN